MGQRYFVVTHLHMNRTILRILAEGQSFSTFHHFFPFFDNESFTVPHGLDSLFMWVILCWQMLRVFQSVKLLVSPIDPHLIMRRTTLHWWLIKPCSFCRHGLSCFWRSYLHIKLQQLHWIKMKLLFPQHIKLHNSSWRSKKNPMNTLCQCYS